MKDSVLIESFLLGKSPDNSSCEDIVVVTNGFIGVVDGATYKGAPPRSRANFPLPGKLVAQLIEQALATLPLQVTARAAIDLISQAVHKGLRDLDKTARKQAAATLVVLSLHRREIWRVGDCLFRVNDREYLSQSSLDDHIAAIRACYNATFLLDGAPIARLQAHDRGRKLVLPLLQRKYKFRNFDGDSPFAFGAIDGTRIPDRFLEVLRLPRKACDIVMCTDGYPRALGSLTESEAYLMEILEKDPLCIDRFMATKGVKPGDHSFDDRAFVRLRI